MKNKGFVFIETIVTVVILSSSLLLLYNSYSSSIYNEKERLYYDDPAYVYRTNQIRKFLEEFSNIEEVKEYSFPSYYIVTIGPASDTLFNTVAPGPSYRTSLQNIYDTYNINQMILVKSDFVYTCFQGTEPGCEVSLSNMSYNLKSYLRSLNEIDYEYYLVVEYAEKIVDGKIKKCIPGSENGCQTYYVSLGV